MMGAVFAQQGFGQLAAAIVALIVTVGFKESLETASSVGKCSGVCQLAVDKMWRVVIGFGAVPACIALYYRLTIPETPRYTFDVAHDILKADEDVRAYIAGKREGHPDEVRRASVINSTADLIAPKASWADFWRHYSQWKNGSILLGTAGSWFFLDVGKCFPPLSTPLRRLMLISCSFLRSWSQQLYHSRCYRLDWRCQRLPDPAS